MFGRQVHPGTRYHPPFRPRLFFDQQLLVARLDMESSVGLGAWERSGAYAVSSLPRVPVISGSQNDALSAGGQRGPITISRRMFSSLRRSPKRGGRIEVLGHRGPTPLGF